MRSHFTPALWITALMSAAGILCAQSPANSDANKNNVVLTQLFAPIYPPIARQARITGDVELNLKVRGDGSIAAVEAVSGHPLLSAAALDSAKRSSFRCVQCSEATVSYRMVYTFQIAEPQDCCRATEAGFPKVSQSENHITVIGGPACICEPAATIVRRRSLKCLYLWRCKTIYFE